MATPVFCACRYLSIRDGTCICLLFSCYISLWEEYTVVFFSDESTTPPDVTNKPMTKAEEKLYKIHTEYLNAEAEAERERANKTSGTTSTPWYCCCITKRGQSSPLKGYKTSPEFDKKLYNWKSDKKKSESAYVTTEISQEQEQAIITRYVLYGFVISLLSKMHSSQVSYQFSSRLRSRSEKYVLLFRRRRCRRRRRKYFCV